MNEVNVPSKRKKYKNLGEKIVFRTVGVLKVTDEKRQSRTC